MSNSSRKIAQSLIALAALGLFAAAAPAQQQAPQGAQGAPSELLQKVQQKQNEIQQLNQQLVEIQQNTIEANPELADKRDELMSMVDEKMAETGHDPEASREKIEDLQGQLDSGDLTDEESRALSQQLRDEQTTMRQAQGQVMQDPEVQSRFQNLNQELVEAMREQNPETEQLLSQLQSAQQEYQSLMQQAMQKHGGNNPMQGG